MKKKVKDLYAILSKNTKEKENLDLIISNQSSYLNKYGLDFKCDRSHNKGFNMKKLNCPVYKCSYCNKLYYLKPFFMIK